MAALSSPSSSRAPISTATPAPISSATLVIDAWKEAVEKYQKTLSKKDQLQVLQTPTGPADVVKDIEKWHEKLDKTKSTKVAAAISSGLARLQRFTTSIDMLAQGSSKAGCLLWGSIKFALTIVQNAVEDYERLCKALTRMIECLPRVELYSDTFMDSSLVCNYVSAFYVSVLRFWCRACKFYRRGRFWNFIQTSLKSYDTEFRELEEEMVKNKDQIEESALAEHIGQSRVARIDQQAMNLTFSDAQGSARKKEITAWLSPLAYDVKYYQKDFEAARKLRHPKTCQWLPKRPEFERFFSTDVSQEPLLWIHSKPGAGKTVLSSYLIEYYRQQGTDHMLYTVLYFFCKNSDEDKNSDTAIIRSFLYQMLQSVKNPVEHRALSDDLGTAVDESGKQRATDFASMWLLFITHINKITHPVIILDALDECREPKTLIQNLMALSKSNGIRVILTSREETRIHRILADKISLEIRPEDVDADIQAFIQAKISKRHLLRDNLVRDMIVQKLSEAHAGMFLWVYLILKELKACRSVEQVEDTLRELPEGLTAMYQNILRRLCKSLKRPALDLAKKIFVWVVTASRPLRIEELLGALAFHYEMERQTLLTGEQLSPYANDDLELVCGSLLTVRDGNIQVIHLTVKEFLGKKEALTDPTDSYTQLLVDPISASSQLTVVSLNYISKNITEPIVDLGASTTFSDVDDRSDESSRMRLSKRLEQSPFTEYASFNWPIHLVDFNWPIHLVDCEGVGGDKIVEAFRSAFDSKATFCWIEMCLTLDPSSSHRIRIGLEDVLEWVHGKMPCAPCSFSQYTFLKNWCSTILRVIDDMSITFRPEEIYRLDFSEIFRSNGLGDTYNDHGHFAARENRTYFDDNQSHLGVQTNTASINPLQPRTMHTRDPEGFIYDHTRDVFITANVTYPSDNRLFLHVQDVKTGRRLSPVNMLGLNKGYGIDFAMSKDGKYLGIVYRKDFNDYTTAIWQIDSRLNFKKRMRSDSWAHEVFSQEARGLGHPRIVWADDGCMYSPVARVHPATGTSIPYPQVFRTWNQIHFSTKGSIFVHQRGDESTVMRYSMQDLEPRERYSISDSRLTAVSPTGRYLLLARKTSYILYDTTSRESSTVPEIIADTLDVDNVFKFSEDENRLVCFSVVRGGSLEARVMDVSGSTPRIRSYGRCYSWTRNYYSKLSLNLCICNQNEIAWLQKDGVVYPIDLSTREIVFPTGLTDTQDFSRHLSQISPDGMSLSVLHNGTRNSQAYVQQYNLNRPEQPPRRLHLAGSETNEGFPTQFSEDATIVVYGMSLYHLHVPNEDQLPVPDAIEIQPIPVVNLNEWKSRVEYIRVEVNNHNDLVAYSSLSNGVRRLSLYRVNLNLRSSVQMQIAPIDDVIARPSIEFHPSLPLALVTYVTICKKSECSSNSHEYDEKGGEKRRGTHGALIVKTLDLTDLEIASVKDHGVFCKDDFSEGSCFDPRPGSVYGIDWYFSNCGTQINLGTICVANLQTEPRTTRVIQESSPLTYKDEYYTFRHRNGLLRLEFSRTHPFSSSDPKHKHVTSEPLTACPSYLNGADMTILLGSTDHDLMRIVFISSGKLLEMKTLLFTFAEVRSQLIKKWDLANKSNKGKAYPDKKEVLNNDEPNVSSSGLQSPSDLITWFPRYK